jgi:hypothetical protein
MPGTFIICLDFELHWGVRDKRTVSQYSSNLLGVRDAIPRLLDLFARYEIHGTWATVGLLFCENKEELLASLPSELPSYLDQSLSPYLTLKDVGNDERSDPFHYAPSLIAQIAAAPGQEIATHTFSHFYCLEPGQSASQFRADLVAACRIGARRNVKLQSIVFPRNQVNRDYLGICKELGIIAYRGTEKRSFHAPGSASENRALAKRLMRLLDTYVPVGGTNTYALPKGEPRPFNLASSRFLRPYSASLSALEPLRLQRVTAELSWAARQNRVFHLWWHPHNFGVHQAENLRLLAKILVHFHKLREQWGMCSLTMCESATLAEQS